MRLNLKDKGGSLKNENEGANPSSFNPHPSSFPLVRGLGLREATALNMIDMVGIGPFVTMALVIDIMSGPQCIIAWVLGALLAGLDGMVWSELGAKWPEAGGSFVFLRKLYGEHTLGKLFSFLFIWQTIFQAPLVIASGSLGFAEHFGYLMPLTLIERKAVSGALVVLLTIVLYRRITTAGRISMIFWVVLILTIAWILFAGATHFNPHLALVIRLALGRYRRYSLSCWGRRWGSRSIVIWAIIMSAIWDRKSASRKKISRAVCLFPSAE